MDQKTIPAAKAANATPAQGVKEPTFDGIRNGKEFNAALGLVERCFQKLVEAKVIDQKEQREMKRDFSVLLDMIGEFYDDASEYEPEPSEDEMEETEEQL